jgi:hypothetical protein
MQLHLIRGFSVGRKLFLCDVEARRAKLQPYNAAIQDSQRLHYKCPIRKKRGRVRNWRERRLQGRLRGVMRRSTRRLHGRQPE